MASESFDSGKGNVGGNLVLSWRATGGVGNKGGLHVRQIRNLEDLTNLPGKMLKGNRYKISAWIKPDGNHAFRKHGKFYILDENQIGEKRISDVRRKGGEP